MKKLLSILTISTLTANIPASLMAMKSSDDEWEIINKDDIPTPNRVKRDVVATKTDVNTRVIKTDGANKPTAQQIKNRLKELNPQLDITKINVTNITNNSAIITSNDKNIYTKNVIVNYTVSISSINW